MDWTKREMLWYERALRWNEYPKQIVEYMKPVLDKEDVLLDIGCGIGTFTFSLADLVKKVVAADIDPLMIDFLQERIKKAGVRGIETRVLDWCNLNPGQLPEIDVAFTAYSGKQIMGRRKSLRVFNNLVAKYVFFLVASRRERHSFGTEELFRRLGRKLRYRYVTFQDLKELLQLEGINFNHQKIEYQFGQPFVTFDEACQFFSFHYKIKEPAEKKILRSFLEEKLEERDDFLWMDNPREGVLVWWKT